MIRLLGPVGPSSRVQARSDIVYTEVDGRPVLCDPVRRSLHELSPAAALLWGRLDGRRLDAHCDHSADGWSELELVEVVRRLRVLDLVEDAEGAGEGSREPTIRPGLEPAVAAIAEEVELAGWADDVAGDVVVVLSRWPGSDSIRWRVDTSSLASDPRPLRALALIDTEGEPGRLQPVDALRVIVGSAAPPALAVGPLDDLARIAESIPVLRAPDSSALSDMVNALGR
jgi:hypothetical protein